MEHQDFRQQAHRDCCHHIDEGVLLDRHGGEADQDRGEDHKGLPAGACLFLLQPAGGNADGVGHMEAGTDPGRRVEGIDKGRHMREEIVPLKACGPQVLVAGVEDIHHHSHGLGDHDEDLEIPEVLHIVQEKIHQSDCSQQEPEAVGDKKELVEGDPIVYSAVHQVTFFHRNEVFCKEIEKKIHQPAPKELQVGELGVIQLGKPEVPVINHWFRHEGLPP